MRFVSIALMLAVSAAAQVTAPLLGWLPEGAQIRPMNGFPAAATLSSALNVGHNLAKTAVSPAQNYVLASDADTGEVLLIVPGVSVNSVNVPPKPDQIVVSPLGSSAILWYSSTGQLEILSGLPAAPAIRQIDASFLHAVPSAIAVSDDGQSFAAASSSGVFEWGPDPVTDNGVPHQVYSGADASALAFFAGNSNLAIATSTQLLSISGASSSVLYQGSFVPTGLATSADNKKIVLADQSGKIYSIDATSHTPSILDCQCQPGGVFGLGNSAFRLTNSSIGPIKLVDANAGAILAVPRAGSTLKGGVKTSLIARPQASSQPLPLFTIGLPPVPPNGYLQQPAVTLTTSSPYPVEIDGNIVLSSAIQDTAVVFSNGTTTVNFTIPAGSTQANFSNAPSVTFSTGTTSQTIYLSANVTAPQQVTSIAGNNITLAPSVAIITSVTLDQTPGGVTVVVTGYSPTREVNSGTFTFDLAPNATIQANDFGVSVSPQFQAWFSNTASFATGTEFTLSVPFSVTGNPANMVGVTVILLNSRGASNPVASQ